jgi:hypothetical protein
MHSKFMPRGLMVHWNALIKRQINWYRLRKTIIKYQYDLGHLIALAEDSFYVGGINRWL